MHLVHFGIVKPSKAQLLGPGEKSSGGEGREGGFAF
jgi:hypothetical protein